MSVVLTGLGCAGAPAEGITQAALEGPVVLQFRTLAPAQSAWGKVLTDSAKTIKEKSGGTLELVWTWSGGGRDEDGMVEDLRNGALDGAALTSVGLSSFVKDYSIFSMPGQFQSWSELDEARDAEKEYFERRFHDAGMVLVGTSDIGAAKIMGTSDKYDDEIWQPKNLSGKRVLTIPGDPIGAEAIRSVGATPVSVPIPEVADKLGSSSNVLVTAPLAATQFQWSPKVTYLLRGVTVSYSTGGLVVSKAKLESLSPEHQKILLAAAGEHSARLAAAVRAEDRVAYEQISRTVSRKHEATEREKAEWSNAFRQVRRALKAQFPKELFERVCGNDC